MTNRTLLLALSCLVPLAALSGAMPGVSGQGEPCHPDDPSCVPKDVKEACTFQQTGIAWPARGEIFPTGAGMGTQLLTLRCPNHIEVGAPQYGYKDCRFIFQGFNCTAPAGDLAVTDLGRIDDAEGCGWTRTWAVSAPSVNLYTFWFRVHTLKDADCDKKADDWNHDTPSPVCPGLTWSECPGLTDAPEPDVWRQTNDLPPKVVNYGDGSLDKNPCWWHNTYYSGRLSFNKPPAGGGQLDPRDPGYAPQPDGEVNECDWQNHEYQWRQWN